MQHQRGTRFIVVMSASSGSSGASAGGAAAKTTDGAGAAASGSSSPSIAGSPPANAQPLTAESLMRQAQSLIDKCQPEYALKFLERAHKIEPKNIEVVDMLAEVCLQAGEMEAARKYLEHSIKVGRRLFATCLATFAVWMWNCGSFFFLFRFLLFFFFAIFFAIVGNCFGFFFFFFFFFNFFIAGCLFFLVICDPLWYLRARSL